MLWFSAYVGDTTIDGLRNDGCILKTRKTLLGADIQQPDELHTDSWVHVCLPSAACLLITTWKGAPAPRAVLESYAQTSP